MRHSSCAKAETQTTTCRVRESLQLRPVMQVQSRIDGGSMPHFSRGSQGLRLRSGSGTPSGPPDPRFATVYGNPTYVKLLVLPMKLSIRILFTVPKAPEFSSLAGGIVAGKLGTATVTLSNLQASIAPA
jgi:hypothetical protein